MKPLRLSLLFSVLIAAPSLAAVHRAEEGPVSGVPMAFPDTEWEVVAPGRQMIDGERLRQATDGLTEDISRLKGCNLDNAVLIRRGQIVWQTPAAQQKKVEHIWSATKSVSSSVLGAMIDRNLCTLDALVADHLPEYREHYGRVTLRHCFTMTSAIRFEGRRPVGPPYGEPGKVYGYSDENISVGGWAVEKICGRRLDALFKEYIGDPIGMRIERWGGWVNAAFGLHTSAHDLARLGHLFLNDGWWKDTQVLSEPWVRLATSVQVPRDMPHVYGKHPKTPNTDSGRYGIAWWLNGVMPDGNRPYPDAPAGLFKASGWQGNRMFVVPEWGIVLVVLQTQLETKDDPPVFNAFFRRLRPALSDLDRPAIQPDNQRQTG
jgi:CubicO group peptidase (beta-lactamase class C family)